MNQGNLVGFCYEWSLDWQMGVVGQDTLITQMREILAQNVRWVEIRLILKMNRWWTESMKRAENALLSEEEKFFRGK